MSALACVLDTSVLQKANATIQHEPRSGVMFRRRLALLQRLRARELRALISRRLLAEYREHVPVPRNESIRAFFELLERGAIPNWQTPWSGTYRAIMTECRFPLHDEHVLRTAVYREPSTIFTEEEPMLTCICRRLRVHIQEPP